MLGGLLPEGMMFPFDFGFIPSTLRRTATPLDILVLMDAPAHVGFFAAILARWASARYSLESGIGSSNCCACFIL
jgi:hypothetical protein